MATKPEEYTPADQVKQEKAQHQQDKHVTQTKPPSDEIPPGNPKEHPSRRRS